MEFIIQVSASPSNCTSIAFRPLGLKDVRYLKDAFKKDIPGLAAKDIRGYSEGRHEKYTVIALDIAEAEKTGHFESDNAIKVTVPENYMNRFCHEAPARYDDPEKTIEEDPLDVGIRTELNKPEFLAEWERLGFPLEIKESDPES